MENKAVIVDLDGTLVRCNTFIVYVRFMAWRHPAFLWHALMRKLRLVSHAEAKRRIMRVNVSSKEISAFVDVIMPYVRPEVEALLKGHRVVLASAAPLLYVGEVARRLGISLFLGSTPDAPENKGDVKLHNVMELLSRHGLEVGMVITDHHDDLPLLAVPATHCNVLVAPSPATVNAVERAGVRISRFL